MTQNIHILNSTGEIFNRGKYKVICHDTSKILTYIKSRDMNDSTNFENLYNQTDCKCEFFKYLVLYYEGGVFVDDCDYNNINEAEIDDLFKYCKTREISLFQCPTAIVSGFIHHPQLMAMLSGTPFHPLSMLYKNITKTVGHKTLVTSLPLKSYLVKLSDPKPYLYFGSGIILGFILYLVKTEYC